MSESFAQGFAVSLVNDHLWPTLVQVPHDLPAGDCAHLHCPRWKTEALGHPLQCLRVELGQSTPANVIKWIMVPAYDVSQQTSALQETVHRFIVPDNSQKRLDAFLSANMQSTSRARLQNIIKEGYVAVNGKPAGKAGQGIRQGDTITCEVPPTVPVEASPEVGSPDPLNVKSPPRRALRSQTALLPARLARVSTMEKRKPARCLLLGISQT